MIKAILATDAEAFTLGVKMMLTALEQAMKLDERWTKHATDAFGLSFEMGRALAKNEGNSRTRFAVALLAQGELQGTTPETIRTDFMQVVDMGYMRQLIDSPANRRIALRVATAIREK